MSHIMRTYVLATGLVVLALVAPSQAATLEVGAGKTYSTIQAAVNAARAGDTIVVYPGTYNEQVTLPDGFGGGATTPIIIRAALPARQPLNGGAWASDPADRAIVNGGGTRAYGFVNANQSTPVTNVVIDGFYFTGQTTSGIYFVDDTNLWIRNNMFVSAGGMGDNDAGIETDFSTGSGWLIQNNYFESDSTGVRNAIGFNSPNCIVEFNHIKLTSVDNRAFYFHLGADNCIVRYNFVEITAALQLPWRFRDHTGNTFRNNFIKSTASNGLFLWHENTDAGLTEGHVISANTFLLSSGVSAGEGIVGQGFQNNNTVNNNIFVGNGSGTHYALYPGFTGQGSGSGNVANNNDVYNLTGLLDPALTGWTSSGTITTNPQVSAATGCAASVDNRVYGADLDVGGIPYRRCDGSLYPFATKFGPGTPPAAPTDLRVN